MMDDVGGCGLVMNIGDALVVVDDDDSGMVVVFNFGLFC